MQNHSHLFCLDSMLYFEFPVTESIAVANEALCHLCMDILVHLTYLHQFQDLAPKKLHRVSMMVISKDLLKVLQILGKNMEASSLLLSLK